MDDRIRLAREEDAEAIARFWRDSFLVWPGGGNGGGLLTPEGVRREMAFVRFRALYLYWDADRVVGYCSIFDHGSRPNTLHVGTLGAHPEWHGRGIGRDLLK